MSTYPRNNSECSAAGNSTSSYGSSDAYFDAVPPGSRTNSANAPYDQERRGSEPLLGMSLLQTHDDAAVNRASIPSSPTPRLPSYQHNRLLHIDEEQHNPHSNAQNSSDLYLPTTHEEHDSTEIDAERITNRQTDQLAASRYAALTWRQSLHSNITSSRSVLVVAACTSAIAMLIYVFFAQSPSMAVSFDLKDGSSDGGWDPQLGLLTATRIPFSSVDRADYGDAAADIVDPNLFDPSLRHDTPVSETPNDETTSSSFGNDKRSLRYNVSKSTGPFLTVPFPTGAFWTNLIVEPTPDQGLSYPIMVYPYGYKWSPSLLQVSYPPLRRLTDDISIRDIFNPDLTLGTVEEVVKRHIVRFDPLSVTVRFFASDSPGDGSSISLRFWESYLVQGSPYVTIYYEGVTPQITALSTFDGFFCPRNENEDLDNVGVDDNGVHLEEQGNTSKRQMSGFGVCRIVDDDSSQTNAGGSFLPTTKLQGVQFLIQTRENVSWMVFASSPITLSFDNISKRFITFTDKFTGVLRMALIPSQSTNPNSVDTPDIYDNMLLSSSPGAKRIIYHSRIYPVGGKVSWSFRAADLVSSELRNKVNVLHELGSSYDGVFSTMPPNAIATVHFQFETKSMTFDSKNASPNSLFHDEIMMLALPHHAQVLSPDTMLKESQFELHYDCIKGTMTPVVGDRWSYDEPLTQIGFENVKSLRKACALDDSSRKIILDQVKADLTRVLPTLDENIYGFGKQVARLAQLTLIANVMEEPESSFSSPTTTTNIDSPWESSSPSVAESATTLLHSFLSAFLSGGTHDDIVYDVNFGGIVTKDGLKNKEADFGNGRYNDHHFHYGYTLYACAVLGKLNTTFVEQYGLAIDALLRDVAHNTNGDSQSAEAEFFPLARHKSWFDGHSFASGLFPFSDGKSQESSSEAVNCYYGAYLWSMVRWGGGGSNNGTIDISRKADFARLLLAMEIRGAKTYWHLQPPNDVGNVSDIGHSLGYSPDFSKSYMAGNVGMMDVTVSTWFGTQSLYVHMINFLPITAITRELFNSSYIEKEFSNIIAPIYSTVPMAWRGYTVCDRAMVDPMEAWKDAQELTSYELDSAISKSQVLYWIATMETFNASTMATTNSSSNDPESGHNNAGSSKSSTLCEDNVNCNALGLRGFCCPTSDGIILGCCNS